MGLEINISLLRLNEEEIKKSRGLDFSILNPDIKFLLGQSPEVFPCYEDKEIDYSEGRRVISVIVKRSPTAEFSYTVTDHASVEGKLNVIVGRKSYTQKEVDELRDQIDPRTLGIEITD